ncbi:hypothetical protein BH09PAT1_BH09PAT1_8170 [soil metagenome]
MKNLLSHLFIPHESNNHRAKLLHHSSLLVLTAILVGSSFLFSFGYKHDRSVLGISYSVTPEDLLIITNQKRQENGLAPLSMDSSLTQAAARKADDMFAKNYWAHIAPDGTTPWYFIKSSGYEYIYAGENLARGYTTSSDVVDAWMASPSHRENMLSPNYKDIGFAIKDGTLTGDDTVLVVEEFGSKAAAVAQVQPEVQAVTPTPIISPVLLAQRIATPTPTPQVTQAVVPSITPSVNRDTEVAAFHSDPLISKPDAQKNIALFVVLGILVLLVLDIIIVKRKNVARILSHNLDHIIFFGMLLLLILILTRGGII